MAEGNLTFVHRYFGAAKTRGGRVALYVAVGATLLTWMAEDGAHGPPLARRLLLAAGVACLVCAVLQLLCSVALRELDADRRLWALDGGELSNDELVSAHVRAWDEAQSARGAAGARMDADEGDDGAWDESHAVDLESLRQDDTT